MRTGKAEDFYLPGLWTNAIYGSAYLVSILLRWPVIGLIIGPLLEENFRWRKDPARTKVYIKATWLWVGMFAIRLVVNTRYMSVAMLIYLEQPGWLWGIHYLLLPPGQLG